MEASVSQDIDLLNQVRKKAEKTVDELCEMTGQKRIMFESGTHSIPRRIVSLVQL